MFDYLYNPFTVASVDESDGSITFIARTREGPMTGVLNAFAAATPGPATEARTITLGIEGPYGSMAKHFHDLLNWGAARVLVVAGGVGATFAVPVFQALQSELPSSKVQLVWALRSAGDAAWAVSAGSPDKTILEDDSVQLYLTGDVGSDADGSHAGAVEMEPLRRVGGRLGAQNRRKRPDRRDLLPRAGGAGCCACLRPHRDDFGSEAPREAVGHEREEAVVARREFRVVSITIAICTHLQRCCNLDSLPSEVVK